MELILVGMAYVLLWLVFAHFIDKKYVDKRIDIQKDSAEAQVHMTRDMLFKYVDSVALDFRELVVLLRAENAELRDMIAKLESKND